MLKFLMNHRYAGLPRRQRTAFSQRFPIQPDIPGIGNVDPT